MNTYDQYTMEQRKSDYLNIILPFLTKSGYEEQKMIGLFKDGLVRVQWGNDFNNFTVYLTNPQNTLTCVMDDLVHLIWDGVSVSNRLVMSCFIERKGVGPISSIAITDLYTLSNGIKKHGDLREIKNSFNDRTFLVLPFSHYSISNNIWGAGIRNF